MRKYKLLIDLPFLSRGRKFYFDDDTAHVFGDDNGHPNEYPLRTGLASYLWLLKTEGDKYLKEIINETSDFRTEGIEGN